MNSAAEPLINVDPEIMGGEPVFFGTRVPVRTLTDWMSAGYSIAEFLENFPSVRREQAVRFLEESIALILERHGAPAA